ncbi:MAG: hypothetical protein ACM3VW_00995 [Bacteroidota bacterium]
MDIRLLVETPVVGLVSLLSFVSPAAATYLGVELAGAIGGIVGWLLSDVFVLAVIFPGLGNLIAKMEGEAPE